MGFATDHDVIDARDAIARQYIGEQCSESSFHAIACHRIADFLGNRDAVADGFGRDGVIAAAAMREQDKARCDKSLAAIGSEKVCAFANHFHRPV